MVVSLALTNTVDEADVSGQADAPGQDPALTDLPHMNMHPHGYQAMMTDDDDWLEDFASAQLQATNSTPSVHTEPSDEQTGEHALTENFRRKAGLAHAEPHAIQVAGPSAAVPSLQV